MEHALLITYFQIDDVKSDKKIFDKDGNFTIYNI